MECKVYNNKKINRKRCLVMKKCFSFFVAFALFFVSFTSTVYGSTGESVTFELSELEFMEYLLSLTDEELMDMGCTREEVIAFRDYDYNQELLKFIEREQLQQDYTQQERAILKAYDGTVDAIEYLEATPFASATLTFNLSCNAITEEHVSIFYTASWNKCPIWTVTDIIAFRWSICDKDSHTLESKYLYSEMEAVYYSNGDKDSLLYHTFPEHQTDGPGTLYYKIPMNEYYSYGVDAIAMEMGGTFWVMPASGSANLHTIQILAAYGHTQFTVVPEVSFSADGAGLGISFTSFVNTEHKKLYRFSIS